MPTLAERWIEEGKEIGLKEGFELGERIAAEEFRREVIRRMIKRNISLELIADCLSIEKEEVKRLMH